MNNFVDLVLTVCTLAQPVACDERHLMLTSDTGSTRNCVMRAMPFIAQWSGQHPSVLVTRWRCVRPGSEGDKI